MNVFSASGLPRNRSVLLRTLAVHLAICTCGNSQASTQSDDGTDRVETNVILRILDAHCSGRVDDCSLRRVIPGQSRSWPDASSRGNVDERSWTACLLHIRHDGVSRVVDRLDVDCEALVEVLVGNIVSWLLEVSDLKCNQTQSCARPCCDMLFRRCLQHS